MQGRGKRLHLPGCRFPPSQITLAETWHAVLLVALMKDT